MSSLCVQWELLYFPEVFFFPPSLNKIRSNLQFSVNYLSKLNCPHFRINRIRFSLWKSKMAPPMRVWVPQNNSGCSIGWNALPISSLKNLDFTNPQLQTVYKWKKFKSTESQDHLLIGPQKDHHKSHKVSYESFLTMTNVSTEETIHFYFKMKPLQAKYATLTA